MNELYPKSHFALRLNELILVVALLMVAIFSIQPFTAIPFGNTAFWWAVQSGLLVSLLFAFSTSPWTSLAPKVRVVTVFYLSWIVIGVLRGALLAETYWQWKELINNVFPLCLPLGMVLGMNSERLGASFSFYLRFVVPLGLLILGAKLGGYGLFVALTPLLVLLVPYMGLGARVIVLLLSISVLFAGEGFRSILIKNAVPIIIISAHPIAVLFPKRYFEVARKTLFVIPLVLLALGASGIFNIFQIGQYIDQEITLERVNAVTGDSEHSSIFADTRTGIYREVLDTFQTYGCWIAGRTPARGSETELFASGSLLVSENGQPERTMHEIGELNIFMWLGLIGIIFQSSIFYFASHHAIANAPSFFGKAAGLYLAFRWAYGWAEEINNYSLTHLSLWILVGICSSRWITELTDADIRNWTTRVFRGQFKIGEISNAHAHSRPPHLS